MLLGHGGLDDKKYSLQSIKDNMSLLTPEILDEINKVVVNVGHQVIGHQAGSPLKGSCDSFVLMRFARAVRL